MTQTVLMAVGPDQPGLVEEVSQFVFERGGNIETSRMANLGGYFVIMVMIGGADETVRLMAEQLPELSERTGLRAELLPIRQAGELRGGVYRLTARGVDRAGMLHQLSHLLRTLGVNIESVNTQVTSAGGGVTPPAEGRFQLEMHLTIPDHVPTTKLREYLGHLWSGQSVSWELVAASPASDDPVL